MYISQFKSLSNKRIIYLFTIDSVPILKYKSILSSGIKYSTYNDVIVHVHRSSVMPIISDGLSNLLDGIPNIEHKL